MKLEECKPGQRVVYAGWLPSPLTHGLLTNDLDFRRRRVRVEWYSLQSASSYETRRWEDPQYLRLEAQQP